MATVIVRVTNSNDQTTALRLEEGGSLLRHLHTQVRRGDLKSVEIDGAGQTTPETPDPDAVPDGNIDEVVAWVRGAPDHEDPADGWDQRARLALDAEIGADKPRSTLLDLLEPLAGGDA